MNLKKQLAVSLLMAGSISVAQATTYDVNAVFNDGGVQGETVFTGSFDWDGSAVSNFAGTLSEAMWKYDGSIFRMGSGMSEMMGAAGSSQKDYITGGYSVGDAPLLSLTNMVDNSMVNGGAAPTGLHAVSVFLMNDGAGNADTDVVQGGLNNNNTAYLGGYDVTSSSTYYGVPALGSNQVRNWNSFFTLAFDELDPTNTTLAINSISYADCNGLGMMSDSCMSAYDTDGSMGGNVSTLSISEVSAVPVPAAAWLFGGALMSLFGANRRKNVLPA